MRRWITVEAEDLAGLLKWGAITLFILWLFYALTAYYVVQKPFSMPLVTDLIQERNTWMRLSFSAEALLRTVLDLGAALWLTFIALGIGLWWMTRLIPDSDSDAGRLLFGLGLGFGTISLFTLLLGLVGLLERGIFMSLAVILTLLTGLGTIRFLRRLRVERPPRLIAIYIAVAVGLALLVALLPPTSWDGLFYHLKGPKLYLEAGRIQPGIDIPHLNFPSLFEMLFMAAMAIRGDVAAQLLHFTFSFMLGGLVYTVARDHLQVKKSWIAVVFLFSTPMVLTLGGWAYNDLALAFYQVGALYALLNWKRHPQQGWLLICGIFCGLAMGLKYTSFVAPLVLMGYVAWSCRRNRPVLITSLLTLATSAAVVAAPWYLKNWFFTGNPVYPFVFGGRFWDEFRTIAYAGRETGIGFNLWGLLRLPHDLTLGLRDASQDGPTGPFYLVFLPVLLFLTFSRQRKSAPPGLSLLLWFALAQYLFWMIGVIFSAGLWQSRLLLPAFVALCPALAWVWQSLAQWDHPQFSLQRFLNLTIGLGLMLSLVSQTLDTLSRAPWAYLIGDETRSDVLRRTLGLHYVAMEQMNAQLPDDAVVAFLWEPRSYYCDRDCRPDSILDAFAHMEQLYEDAAGIAEAWRQEGVTYVLLHQAGLDFVMKEKMDWVAPAEPGTLQELQTQYLAAVATWDDGYVLYRMLP